MKIKFTAIIILCVLVSQWICSCGSGTDKPTETTGTGTVPAEETQTETEFFDASYLPESDFGGSEFRMVTDGSGIYSNTLIADVEESSGDVIRDAFWKRNSAIEEKYNIVFRQINVNGYEAMTANFKKAVASASDDFDLGLLIMRDAFTLALDDMIVPVENIPYIDISQPWYVRDINDSLTIGGKLLFAYSDECLNLLESSMCVNFNYTLAEKYAVGGDSLYKAVYDGQWDYDMLHSTAKSTVFDLDGDGKMTDSDQWGIVTEVDMYSPSLWIGMGEKLVLKDSADIPYLNVNGNDRIYGIFDRIWQLQNDGNNILIDVVCDKMDKYKKQDSENYVVSSRGLFVNGGALYRITPVTELKTYRDMDADFGLLPLPKYDENQDGYRTRVIDGWIFCVPVTASDLGRTGIILEELAVQSKNYVLPAFYEVALKVKYSRDDDTAAMLDLIKETRTLDLGDTVWFEKIRIPYQSMFGSKSDAFASTTEKNLKSMQAVIDKAIEKITR